VFFPDRIRSISPGDRVLEVGPGGTPHPRSNVLLERRFDPTEAAAQRGHAPAIDTGQEIVIYDGGPFPFADRSFDYVICSHVLEHIDDVPAFVAELGRVAGRGYLEFPTAYYEYLYNFPVHRSLLHYDGAELLWLPKERFPFAEFLPVQTFFYHSLGAGYDEMVVSLKEQMCEGFEWIDAVRVRPAASLAALCPAGVDFKFPPNPHKVPQPTAELIREIGRRVWRRLGLFR
jgi:SAM-dependent methyltransferase